MNQKIIETNNLKNEVPQYRTWYRLHEDVIFVSVIYPEFSNYSSHFRRKSKPETNQNKKDSDMCFWHSDWQFSKIESEYGVIKSGNKTYEITVKFNDEIHRIDSVVENIAIEFQHTLSVSVNEMESRYIAHKALGFKPYLVLDFSDYSAKDTILRISNFDYKKIERYIHSCTKDEKSEQFLKKIKKWLNSRYFRNNNLFLDFNDYMIRILPNSINTIYKYERVFFIKNLLSLEIVLEEAEKNAKHLIAKRKKENELRLLQVLKQEKEYKIAHNKNQILQSQNYQYFRKCELNKHIKQAISKLIGQPEYISYSLKQGEYLGLHRKLHIYRLYIEIEDEPIMEIQYALFGSYKNNQYSFSHSEIDVIRKTGENNTGIKRMSLRQKPKERIKLVAIRNEIVKGYLHSLDNYAYFSYNENEEVEKKEHYIFNNIVPKSIYNELSNYFSSNGCSKVESQIAQNVLENIYQQERNGYNFYEDIMQNYLPEDKLEEYYKNHDEILPFADEKIN